MACDFHFKPKQGVDAIYDFAIKELVKFDATSKGDRNGGDFKINILGMSFRGVITVKTDVILVSIKDKPLLVPCALIKNAVKSYLSEL